MFKYRRLEIALFTACTTGLDGNVLITGLLLLKLVKEVVKIPICIAYRRRYGLFADISVLPIRQMLIGIGYRYRPISYFISVFN